MLDLVWTSLNPGEVTKLEVLQCCCQYDRAGMPGIPGDASDCHSRRLHSMENLIPFQQFIGHKLKCLLHFQSHHHFAHLTTLIEGPRDLQPFLSRVLILISLSRANSI